MCSLADTLGVTIVADVLNERQASARSARGPRFGRGEETGVRSGRDGGDQPVRSSAEAQLPVRMNVCGQPPGHARHRIVGTGSTPFSLKHHPRKQGN